MMRNKAADVDQRALGEKGDDVSNVSDSEMATNGKEVLNPGELTFEEGASFHFLRFLHSLLLQS